MDDKVSVKGNDIATIFKWLVDEAANKGIKDPITWNFTKFLVDEKGNLVTEFSPKTTPMSEEVLKYLN